ncbi:MAG: WYL domain-containing protein [Pseudomonadota bacterium]
MRLLLHLWEHGRVSTAEAARLVDSTPRRARADLELLGRFLPVEAHGTGRGRYWLLEPGFATRNLAVLDRISLLVGKELTAFLHGTALHEGFWRVEDELRQGVAPRFARHFDRKFHLHPEPARRYHDQTDLLDDLLDALLRELRVHLTHHSVGSEAREHRDLEPLSLVIYRRALYLLARRPDGQIRRFAVDRIERLEKGEHFDYPESWDPARELAGTFGVFSEGPPERIRLRFSPWAAPYVRARDWHPSQRLIELDDGGVDMILHAGGRELVRLVLEWGAGCRAVEPPELVEAVRAELEGALRGYDGGPCAPGPDGEEG